MMSDVGSVPDDGLNKWLTDYHQGAQSAAGILRELSRDAASWDLRTRLTMRTSPIFGLIGCRHRVQKLAVDLTCARDLTRDLDLAGDLTRDLAHASARDRAHDMTRDLARVDAQTRDVVHDLELVRNLDLVRGRDFARDLGLVRDLAVGLAQALDLARDLARARDRALAHAHAVGLSLTYGSPSVLALGFGLSFAHALTLVRDYQRDVYRALSLARDRALTLDCSFARALDRDATTKVLIGLHHALSDVTDHDLRDIDLAAVSLEGLRWSTRTRWPPHWEDQIRRASAEVADGTFQVVGRGTRQISTKI